MTTYVSEQLIIFGGVKFEYVGSMILKSGIKKEYFRCEICKTRLHVFTGIKKCQLINPHSNLVCSQLHREYEKKFRERHHRDLKQMESIMEETIMDFCEYTDDETTTDSSYSSNTNDDEPETESSDSSHSSPSSITDTADESTIIITENIHYYDEDSGSTATSTMCMESTNEGIPNWSQELSPIESRVKSYMPTPHPKGTVPLERTPFAANTQPSSSTTRPITNANPGPSDGVVKPALKTGKKRYFDSTKKVRFNMP